MRSGISVWKRMRDNLSVAIVFVAALLFLILTLSGKVFANDQIVPDDRNKLKEGNLYVGFPGTYVIDEYEEAKALINQYRKEAGDYNVTVSIMGSITSVLSPENVNEVKLSSSLEKCAQVRAAEASFMLDHTRPRQPGDQDSGDGSLSNCDSSFFSGFESLYAYGNMISAVKAFYEEKKTFDSYIQNATTDKSGVKKVEISAQQFPSVGHYLSMILPEYQYFGIGTFKLDGRNYYATAAEFYKTWPKEYEAYGYETMPKDIIVSPAGVTGHVIQKIEANSKRTTLDLSAEDDSFEMGETMILSPTAVIKSVNGKRSKDLVVYGGLTWLSSDDSVGKVNESGTVSALKPGEVKITASCGEASAEKVLNVTKVSLSSASVILSDSVYTYDGIPKKPGVTVTIKGVTLTEGSDYTVSYENNENAGTAQVVITAIESGNYKDSCRKEFTITSAPLENYEIESIPAQTYTGEPIIPQVTVSKTGGAVLVQGRDYTVTVQDNTNAGNAEVTVTGKQNYTGTLTGKFTINKVNLETNANVRIATIPDLIYTGSAREPKVLITYLTDELNLETDYSVEYSENTNAGNAVAIVKGLGNYEGSRKLTFKINPAELTKLEGISSKVYSGAELSQDNLIVKAGDLTVGKTDYSVEYTNNVDVGTAEVSVVGQGNFTGTCTGTFSVLPANLSDGNISGLTDKEYSGLQIKEIPLVSVNGRTLNSNTDYTLTYDGDLVNAGIIKVTATGKGNYTGELVQTYSITQKDITLEGAVEQIDPVSFTGMAIEPNVSVKVNSQCLSFGTDYTVDYDNNVNAGTADITAKGIGNYTGSVNGSFVILPRQMGESTISLGEAPSYTGDAVTVPVTITYGNSILVPGTDFDCEFGNNVAAGENTATIRITGKNNYAGELAKTFSIRPADLSEGIVSGLADQTYSGEKIKEEPSVSMNGGILTEGVDYTLTYEGDLFNAGIITVTITGTGNYTGELEQTYSIQPRDIFGEANIKEIESVTYTGQPHTPETIVKIGENTLVRDADYEVSYVDNIDAGSASVVVTGIGNYTGTAEQVFTISPADLTEAEITPQACIYTGAPVTAVLSVHLNGAELQETTDYTVSYVSGQDYTKTGQPAVKVVGCGNYTGEKETAINILPADISTVIVSAPDQTWTGSELRPAVTVKLNGRVLPAEDYTVEYANNIAAGTASILVKPSGNGNLSGESASGTFVIKEKPAAPQTNPAPSTKPVVQPSSQSTQQPSSQPAQQPAAQPAPQPQQSPAVIVESITIPKAPASVKAKAKKNKVTVSWKKIKKSKKTKALLAQIHGIELQYSTEPGFPAENTVKVSLGKKKTKLVLKGLSPKTVYYVRVRYTDGSGGYSNWSKVKAFRTK